MFGRAFPLFRLFGFEVRIDASWFIIAALVTWSLAAGMFPAYAPGLPRAEYFWMGIAGALLLFGSIVFHELFHSLVARRYGIPMRGITLFVFGGVAEMNAEPPSPKAEFLMAVAGPLASVVLGLTFYGVAAGSLGSMPVETSVVLRYLAQINLLLAAFNCIPAFPLDGGRILRSILWHSSGNVVHATRTASRIGSGFAIVLMIYAVFNLFFGNFVTAVWWFTIGMFLRSAAMASYQQMLMQSALQGEPVSHFMTTDVDTVSPDTSVEDLVVNHMYRNHHRLYPVLAGSEQLAGCVSAEQVKTLPREEWPNHTVREIATPCSPQSLVTPETDSMRALKMMQESNSTKLMVVQGGRLVAMVTLRDLLNFLATKLELEGGSSRFKTV